MSSLPELSTPPHPMMLTTMIGEDAASVVSASSSSASSSFAAATATLPSSSNSSSQNDGGKMREPLMLPKGFEPTAQDVIIGRGKRARTHEGNQRLKGLIDFMIPEYSAAGSNKDEKSYIIKEIVVQIRKSSPDGGFVKFDKSHNRWFEVGDFCAREKISQTFRDAMGDAYSSSNPFKRKRRSFEKKHNAILDIIKRRGSSPTSVLAGGTVSPGVSPCCSDQAVGLLSHHHHHHHHSMASPPLLKRPGQIGFARAVIASGAVPPPPLQMYHPSTTAHHHSPYPYPGLATTASSMVPPPPSTAAAAAAVGLGGHHPFVASHSHSHYAASPLSLGMLPLSRRASIPGAVYPHPATASMMADYQHHHHHHHHHHHVSAMPTPVVGRRSSAPAVGIPRMGA